MNVIYVAGKYTADTEWGIWNNIEHASREARKLWKDGWAVICPHKNTSFFGGEDDRDLWLRGDLEILSRCDAIFLLLDWQRSEGATKEYERAVELGLRIYEESIF